MENPNESIANLTANIVLFELDLKKVFSARQEIASRISAGTHTQKDIQVYIILSKRIISTLERKIQTLEKIKEYYEENEPDNIKGKQWSNDLEVSLLEIKAHQSALDNFLNGSSPEGTNELFRQFFMAKKRADDFSARVDSLKNPNNQRNRMPGLAEAFFQAPGPTYQTLVSEKLIKPDGTELNLPNCKIDSFTSFRSYGKEFESFYRDIIQVIQHMTDSTRGKMSMALQSGNNKAIEEAWTKVEELTRAQTKQAEELLALYRDIQRRIPLPVTIDSDLETDLFRLDALQKQLERSMVVALEARKAFYALIG